MILTKWLNEVSLNDGKLVGGKNASLGEMICNLEKLGIKVPFGFVVTSDAYSYFLKHNNLEQNINNSIKNLNFNDPVNVRRISQEIRRSIENGVFPEDLKNEIHQKYFELSQKYKSTGGDPQEETDVAVRSSATVEDLPDASFAGQQDTYLNVRGKNYLLEKIKSCFASIFNERAVDYRHNMNFHDVDIKLSVCIQKMVRSDLSSAGVAFSIDTESGNENVVVINSSYGLGEMVVSGQVQPDEYLVFKPTLKEGYRSIIDKKLGNKAQKMVYSDNQDRRTKTINVTKEKYKNFSIDDVKVLQLATWVMKLEEYYSQKYERWCPVDVEWAIDGLSNELYVVQTRPETVYSNKSKNILTTYSFKNKKRTPILEGVAVGDKIANGKAKILQSIDSRLNNVEFLPGDVLVTEITDPDWEPIMKIASAIITEKGGRTCHAAIVARELGVPAIVGVNNACEELTNHQEITISCAEGERGFIYDGYVEYKKEENELDKIEMPGVKIMMNVASPSQAFQFAKIPNCGVGLAREEFIINNFIKVHPLALLHPEKVTDLNVKEEVKKICQSYANPVQYFVRKLAFGIARIAGAFYPNDVIVRFSDFKSNEYANLVGGKYFEPHEENPMIGWRGASRYYSPEYEEAFGLECKAIKYVREMIGLKNVIVMIPFCRTVEECKQVLEVMAKYGLERGINGLQVYLMCEIPSNVILADEFCDYIDGFSIGSNDLTQLTLGLDRDSELVQHIYNERNPAVKSMISKAIKVCKNRGKKVGICGQGPSDFPDFAQFLIEEGIDSISLTPDSVLKTILQIKK